MFDYGGTQARWRYAGRGYGSAVAEGPEGGPTLRLTTSLRLGLEGHGAYAAGRLMEGDVAFPQAFTHLALIDSVLRVLRDGEHVAYAGQPCARPRGRHTDDRASRTHLTIVGKRIT